MVGLLNALGASKKLTMVIAGESLMNDGIAIVGFTLFKNLLHGKSYDFAGVVEFFLQVCQSPSTRTASLVGFEVSLSATNLWNAGRFGGTSCWYCFRYISACDSDLDQKRLGTYKGE